MLLGFLLGIGAAFFWSITNIIDKYLITRYAPSGNIGGILLLSCFFPSLLMLLAYTFDATVFSINTSDKLLLMVSGILMVGWIFFYLKALAEDEASVVMIMLVLAPLFSLLFSSVILHEQLTLSQMIGGGLIILGALSVSYEPGAGRIKWALVGYGISACVTTGLMYTLFKFATVPGTFLTSVFWRSAGMIFAGTLIYILVAKYRHDFHVFAKRYLMHGVSLNTINETLSLLADSIFAFGMLLTPVALVQTTESYQPFFIMLIVLVLAKMGVTTIEENMHGKKLYFKLIGAFFVISGSLVLSTF